MNKEEVAQLVAAMPPHLDADEFIFKLINWAIDLDREKRKWVGLNDLELESLSHRYQTLFGGYVRDFAQDIEKALKEKNT